MSNRETKRHQISRRHFLRQGACAALGVTGLVNTLANLRLMSAAMAQGTPAGYKALVCIFLGGGNDSNNLLIPHSGDLRTDYEAGRGILSILPDDLRLVTPDNDTRDFGLHPECQEMADLFAAGDLAFVNNVGTLSYPIATREEYLNDLVPVPPQLFSHADQQLQWQSSVPDKPFQTGWGGRMADLLHAAYNSGGNVSTSISLDGINSFQVGLSGETAQYILNRTGISSLSGYGTAYGNALNGDGTYKTTDTGWRFRGLREVMNLVHGNLLEDGYSNVVTSGLDTEATIGAALTAAAAAETAGGFTFDDIFTTNTADTKLGDELKMVARMIAGRDDLNNSRQIFFCRVGGYDTHQLQLSAHGSLMDELNHAIKAFHQSLVTLGVLDQVTTFTVSEFNRTFTPNGEDDQAGADHGWGGNQIVMGGAVKGRNLYGAYPELLVNAGLDAGTTRGRWIPTTAVDQYSAVLAKWMGVESSAMETIFPNLSRFDDPFTSSAANLDFIDFIV